MSTISRPRANSVSIEPPISAAANGQMCAVAWLVSRSAMRAALARTRPEITVAQSRSSDSVRLVWRVRIESAPDGSHSAFAQATLEDLEHRTAICLTGEMRGAAIRDAAGSDELLHIEVPGSLVCTLRASKTLYASSPLLAALGLDGGRYDVVT